MPAQPKKIRGKKRDEPAVIILLVKPPIVAEMTATNKPERAESEGEE